MERLIAVRRVTYARRDYLPGQRFATSDVDAKILIAGGFARNDVTPQPVVIIEAPKPKRGRPRKNQYGRRDMRVED